MDIRSGGITIWNEDGTGLQTNNLWWVASLVCHSFVQFGDKTRIEYEPATLINTEWRTIRRLGQKVPLDSLGPDFKGKDDDIYSIFTGAIMTVEGKDLRLRTRALAGHYGESFPEDKYPNGPMRLYIDGLDRKIKHDKILDKINELKRANK